MTSCPNRAQIEDWARTNRGLGSTLLPEELAHVGAHLPTCTGCQTAARDRFYDLGEVEAG